MGGGEGEWDGKKGNGRSPRERGRNQNGDTGRASLCRAKILHRDTRHCEEAETKARKALPRKTSTEDYTYPAQRGKTSYPL